MKKLLKMDHIYKYDPNRYFGKRNVDLYLLDQMPIRSLLLTILRRLQRKLIQDKAEKFPLELATIYQGISVFHRRDLHGEGMTVGEEFIRILHGLGISQVDRAFEFCAGPGYIGYSLLAYEVCKNLTLADINPFAIESSKKTREFNGLEKLVNIYQSDVLKDIPNEEKWDLVVGNPVHFDDTNQDKDWRAHSDRDKIAFDPNWNIHRSFYTTAKKHMKPKGLIVMQENAKGSSSDTFKSMIEEGGGELIKSIEGKNIIGGLNEMYYVVSRW